MVIFFFFFQFFFGNILFWGTTRLGFHALVPQNTSVFKYYPVLQHCIYPLGLKSFVLAPGSYSVESPRK